MWNRSPTGIRVLVQVRLISYLIKIAPVSQIPYNFFRKGEIRLQKSRVIWIVDTLMRQVGINRVLIIRSDIGNDTETGHATLFNGAHSLLNFIDRPVKRELIIDRRWLTIFIGCITTGRRCAYSSPMTIV